MKPEIAIIADDLTGAGDSAVQFVRCGWETQLYVGGSKEAFSQPGIHADVVSINSNSRGLAAEAAAQAVASEIRTLKAYGVRYLFKKVDSTLRGPFLAEIDAARQHWHDNAVAVVCPAFPATGRTVEAGVLLVNGVPVTETSAGSDPVTPVTQSHIPSLLGCTLISPQQSDTAETLAEKIRQSGHTVVVDAVTNQDLKRLARAIVLLGEQALPVGAGGLAMAMAAAWAHRMDQEGIVLAVVTSQHSATRRQVRVLQERGGLVMLPTLEVLNNQAAFDDWKSQALDGCRQALQKGQQVVALVAPEGQYPGLSPEMVAWRLARFALDIVNTFNVKGIIGTGGDGAEQVMKALQATGIRLLDEVSGGVPLGTLIGGDYAGMPIVTKAGGFGADDILIQAAENLMERKFK